MSRFTLTPFKPHLVENDIEKQCLDLAQLRGYKPERLQAGRFYASSKPFRDAEGKFRAITIGYPGRPDYLLGHSEFPAFYLETKRPGGKLSPQQAFTINGLVQGCHMAVCVTDDVYAFRDWLDAHEQKAHERWRKNLSLEIQVRGP